MDSLYRRHEETCCYLAKGVRHIKCYVRCGWRAATNTASANAGH
jgi:hypothetical protein